VNHRPVLLSVLLIVVTMSAGLAIRFVHLDLPPFLVKYGGSALWAIMIYWLASSALPATRAPASALLAGGVATAVECFKLYHAPALDDFRHTVAGAVLLGRIFSFVDILVYWLAIAIAASLDVLMRRHQ
jgi:hypothetical protein